MNCPKKTPSTYIPLYLLLFCLAFSSCKEKKEKVFDFDFNIALSICLSLFSIYLFTFIFTFIFIFMFIIYNFSSTYLIFTLYLRKYLQFMFSLSLGLSSSFFVVLCNYIILFIYKHIYLRSTPLDRYHCAKYWQMVFNFCDLF